MDKNTYTGMFLILVILVGSFFLMKPSQEEIKKEQQRQHLDSLKKAGVLKPAAAVKPDTSSKKPAIDSAVLKAPFGAATYGSAQFIYLDNKDVHITLSNKGGRVYAVELKDFKTFDKKPLVLFSGDQNQFGLRFTASGKPISTNDLYFQNAGINKTDTATDLTLRLSYSPTQYVDYIYHLSSKGYKLGFTVKLTGLQGVVSSNALALNWTASLLKQEKDIAQVLTRLMLR
jgi:YidC/Oxa1 family membrane protein insertase